VPAYCPIRTVELRPPPEPLEPFGPWRDDISPTQRARHLGVLEAFAHAYLGGDNPVSAALARANATGMADDMAAALAALNDAPALQRRKILGSYARRVQPGRPAITNGKAKRGAA
jgi:hypothetical protein